MFELTKEFTFDAAHYLRDYEGKCSAVHGHTYKIVVTLNSDISISDLLDLKACILLDFGVLSKLVKEKIIDRFDHKCLNDVAFTQVNPTAEAMSCFFYKTLHEALKSNELDRDGHIWIASVIVWETPNSCAKFYAPTKEELEGTWI